METIKTHISDLKPGDKIKTPPGKHRFPDQLTVRHINLSKNEVLIMESGGISLVASHFEKVVQAPEKSKAIKKESNQLKMF